MKSFEVIINRFIILLLTIEKSIMIDINNIWYRIMRLKSFFKFLIYWKRLTFWNSNVKLLINPIHDIDSHQIDLLRFIGHINDLKIWLHTIESIFDHIYISIYLFFFERFWLLFKLSKYYCEIIKYWNIKNLLIKNINKLSLLLLHLYSHILNFLIKNFKLDNCRVILCRIDSFIDNYIELLFKISSRCL